MSAENKIEVDVDLAIRTALKSIDELNKKFDSFAENTDKNSKKAASSWDVFVGTLEAAGVQKILGIARDAAVALFDTFIIQGVEAASSQEEALNAMNIALSSTGNFSDQASLGMVEFADSLEKTTKFSDDQILRNAALIESMAKLSGDGLKRATQAAVELAATYQIDLETASRMVGKAAEGNIVAFQKMGIVIEKSNDDSVTFANTLNVLLKMQGNAAEQAKTFAGANAILSNSFEEMQQQTGKLITENPAVIAGMNILSDTFRELAKEIEENKEELQAFVVDSIFAILDASVIFVKAFEKIAEVGQFMSKSIASSLNPVILIYESLGLMSEETAEKIGKSFDFIAGIDVAEIFGKVEDELVDLTEKFETAVDTQDQADERRNKAYKKRSVERTEATKAELERSKQLNFSALFEIEKFEKLTSAGKIQREKDTFSIMATLMKSENMTLFRIGQAAAIANATIDGISAVMNALEAFPYPYNIVVGAVVAGIAAANIAKIAAATPSFAEGGIVPGSSFTGDRIQANVNSGEMVLTMSDQLDLLRQIRNGQAGSGGGGAVIIQGNVYADDDAQVDRLMARIQDRLEFGNGSLSPVV